MIRREVAEKHKNILSAYGECEATLERATAEIEADHEQRVARLSAKTKDRRRAAYRSRVAELERRRDSRLRKAIRQTEALSESSEYQAYIEELHLRGPEIAGRNRAALLQAISESGPAQDNTVVVTHERLTRTAADLADVPLFLFGHRHGFYDRSFAGSRFVNVSVLDNPITVRPKACSNLPNPDEYRNLNNGNYVIIEGGDTRELEIRCVRFDPKMDNWEPQPFVIIGEKWAEEV